MHLGEALVEAPARLPYLWDLAFTAYAFLHFAAVCTWLNVRQWRLPGDAGEAEGGKAKVKAA